MRIDAEGSTMMLEADKYAIMHRVGIHARDLRILDPLLSYPSTILGRERAIVLNLEVSLLDDDDEVAYIAVRTDTWILWVWLAVHKGHHHR